MMRLLILGAAVLAATPALAGPVTLKANPVDTDGRVTLGEIFDGAGAMADVEVGRRHGPSVVFEAGQLQALARQSGLDWANPTGLRRVVVRHVTSAPVYVPAGPAESAPDSAAPAAATVPAYRPAAAPRPTPPRAAPAQGADRVIARNDMVEVLYEVGGVRLTVSGRAETNAAVGQRVGVRNLQSNRVIEAVAIGPGQALAGPAAQDVRLAAAR